MYCSLVDAALTFPAFFEIRTQLETLTEIIGKYQYNKSSTVRTTEKILKYSERQARLG